MCSWNLFDMMYTTKFHGPVMLLFCFYEQRLLKGWWESSSNLWFLELKREKTSPFSRHKHLTAWRPLLRLAETQKRMRLLPKGFMPPYCHGEDQTWWYVGWLVVFWSGFNYWHCLFRSLSWKVQFAASHTRETSHRFPRPSDIWTDIPLWRPTMFKSLHFINCWCKHGHFFEELNTFSGTVFHWRFRKLVGFGSHQADPLKSPNDAMNDRLIDLSCVGASGKA